MIVCVLETDLLPATVLESPTVAVVKSNFVDETPKRMQTTIN